MKKKVSFSFDTQVLKEAALICIYIFFIIGLMSYVVIPVFMFILDLLGILFTQYLTLEDNFKFFGTFVILIIVWKLFVVLSNIILELFKEVISLLKWKPKKK